MKKNRGLIVLCICSLLIGLIGCGQPEVTEAWEADQIKRLTSIAATTFLRKTEALSNWESRR